jgi:hypothetical protein
MNKFYKTIKDEQGSDIALIQKLQYQQDNTKSVVEQERLEREMIKIQGRIDGLNIALQILS